MHSIKHSSYKWYILTLGMLTFFLVAGLSRQCIPVLFKAISLDLNLSMVAIGTIWGMDPLAGVLVALPGGLLVDRFGIKSTLAVICFFAGLFGALRGLSVNFLTMAASTFLFGLMAASVPGIIPKTTALWFSGKQLGTTNALLNISWAVGIMIATMFSATVFAVWLGGWRPVLFLFGLPCIILAVLWLTSGKEVRNALPVDNLSSPKVSLKEALHYVVRSNSIWLLGIIGFCNLGAVMAMMGYLPLYLRNIGWAPAIADMAVTINNGVAVLGILPIVAMANRIGSPKTALFFVTIISAATFFLLAIIHSNAIWIVLLINGFLRNSIHTLLILCLLQMESIDNKYAGTALGLMNTIGMLGAVFAPPAGNALTAIGPGMPFVFWGLYAAAAVPLFYFVKDKYNIA